MRRFLFKKINYLIPLLIAGFAFFVAYHHVGLGVINYIDHGPSIYFSEYLRRLSFVWNDYIYLGSNQATSLINGIPYIFFLSLFERMGFNYILINRLDHVIPVFCIIYFTYLFLLSLFKKEVRPLHKLFLVLAGTFFLTNVSVNGLFTMGLTQGVFALSGIPLALFSLRKYGLTNRKIYLLLLAVSSLIITCFNLPYNVISMALVLLLAMSFNDINIKSRIKNIILFLLIWLSLNCFWILPMFYSIFIVPPYNLKGTINNVSALLDVMRLTASRYTIDQLMRLGINLDLIKTQNADNSTMVNYFAGKWYVILSYVTVFSLFLRHLILKPREEEESIKTIWLISIFLVFIFLAKGLNQPFGDIYSDLFDKTIFFKLFRDSLKWMIIPFFVVIILMANALVKESKIWIKLVIIFFLLANLFPWIDNGLMGRLRAYSIPEYYSELHNYYESVTGPSDKRAIILDSVIAPTSFEFDINNDDKKNLSNNILKFISPLPTVDLFSNGGGLSADHLKSFYINLKKTDEDIKAFQEVGATHVYHQRDIMKPSEYVYTNEYFNKKSFGKIDVYEIKNEYVVPKIFLSGTDDVAEVEFYKINPTKYKIRIYGIKKKAILNFLYTFDSNWSVYLEKTSSLDCSIVDEWYMTEKNNIDGYKNNFTNSKQCTSKEDFFQGDDLSYIWKPGDFKKSHGLLNQLFNKWIIDPEYIKENFNDDYYQEGSDGSVSLELTLYFRPQSYLYIGFFIGGATLLVGIGFFGYPFVRKRIFPQRADDAKIF